MGTTGASLQAYGYSYFHLTILGSTNRTNKLISEPYYINNYPKYSPRVATEMIIKMFGVVTVSGKFRRVANFL